MRGGEAPLFGSSDLRVSASPVRSVALFSRLSNQTSKAAGSATVKHEFAFLIQLRAHGSAHQHDQALDQREAQAAMQAGGTRVSASAHSGGHDLEQFPAQLLAPGHRAGVAAIEQDGEAVAVTASWREVSRQT